MFFSDLLILMALFLSKFRSRRKQPKEKPDRRQPRKPIARRGHITVHDNPLKIDCRKAFTGSQADCIAKYRTHNLARYSPALEALDAAHRGLGILFRPEEPIIVDYRTFFLVDRWCYNIKVGWEADGNQHKGEDVHDRERDALIQRLTGFRIIRHWNSWYLRPGLSQRILIELGKR